MQDMIQWKWVILLHSYETGWQDELVLLLHAAE